MNIFLIRKVIITIVMTGFLSACATLGTYPSIQTKVVDAQTGKPIEGAVLLVQWTKTTGFGYRATSNFKVEEILSDENGEFNIPGLYEPGVDQPDLIVYKRGYVAWREDRIFPSLEKRKDFYWTEGYVFKLERFKPDYSYFRHTSFISSGYSSGVSSKGTFASAWVWESKLAREEYKKLRTKNN